MSLTYARPLSSLIVFAQFVVETLAAGLVRRLGFGRFGAAVFLRRDEHRAMSREIGEMEALTRRALFLLAAREGGLAAPEPVKAVPPRPAGKPAQRKAREAGLPRRAKPPVFRLTEPQPSERSASGPSKPRAPTAPVSDADLIPAARLVRRLRALTAVFEDPYGYIFRMRCLIGAGARAILSPQTPVPKQQKAKPGSLARMILDLQDACNPAADYLDTG